MSQRKGARHQPQKTEWTKANDRTLILYLREGYAIPAIAKRLKCGQQAVAVRIRELGLNYSFSNGRKGVLVENSAKTGNAP